MAFAGIFQPFARLRWIRFGLLMRDCKFSRRFSVPQTTALARMALLASPDVGVRVRAFLESFDSPERVTNQLVLLNSAFLVLPSFHELILLKVVHACGEATAHRLL